MDAILSGVGLCAMLIVPGYATFMAFREPIKHLKISFFEYVFFWVLIGALMISLIAFTLAALGYFSLFNLLALVLAYTVATVLLGEKKNLCPRITLNLQTSRIDDVQLLFLFLLAAILFLHPFEYLSLHRDAGVLFNTGVHIAKTGSLVFTDPILKDMPLSARKVFYQFGQIAQTKVYGLQFPLHSLYVTDLQTGEVRPGYLKLYPVWVAIIYSFLGLRGALYTVSLFGILSVIGIYLTAKSLFDSKIGTIASILLCLNFVQIYFSRLPGAEILFQFLTFGGIYSFVFFYRTNNTLSGIISALCFGELFLTRLDAVLLIVPLSLYMIYEVIKKKIRKRIVFHLTFLLLLLFSVIYYIRIEEVYITAVMKGFIAEEIFGEAAPGANNLIANIERLGWYAGDLTILLACVGVIFILQKDRNIPTYLFLGIGLSYFLFYLNNVHNIIVNPWVMRRYVSVTVPFLILCATYSLRKICGRMSRGKTLGILLICYLVIFSIVTSTTVINHVDFEGLTGQAEEFAGYFDDEAIVIFNNDMQKTTLSYPMKYIFNKNSILLPREPTTIEEISEYVKMCRIWDGEGRKIYVINPSDGFMRSLSEFGVEFVYVTKYTTDVPYLKTSVDSFPSEIDYIKTDLQVYRLQLRPDLLVGE